MDVHSLTARSLNAGETRRCIPALAEILMDCVDGGASVGFMAPFSRAEAEAFFEKCAASIERRERILIAAFDGDTPVGTVQIVTAMPPNQPHRAEVAKLLVPRWARRRGIGMRLMQEVESRARAESKTLLVLDTATGDAAEKLYERLGWNRLGVIPGYAKYPDGSWGDTTFFWKKL